jgi:hypothetical protein
VHNCQKRPARHKPRTRRQESSAPRTAKPSRRGVQTHATPFQSHREYLKRSQSATTLTPSRCPPPEANTPRTSRAKPATTRRKRPESRCSSAVARASPEPVHTRQPLAGVCPCPALRRAQPRRARGAVPRRRSPTGARRTFEEPPRTCRERAQRCQVQKPYGDVDA